MSSYCRLLANGFAILAISLVIVAPVGVSSEAHAEGVAYLKLATPRTMGYMVTISPEDRASAGVYLEAALALIMMVPPAEIRLQRGEPERFDFTIDLTTSDRAYAEMAALSRVGIGSSTLSYTVYHPETRRYVVRLLWDRIGKVKNNRGEISLHPNALPRLVSALAREVYGSLKTLSKQKAYRYSGVTDPPGRRDSYRESAKTLERIIEHPRFAILDERDRASFRAEALIEFQEAVAWESIIEGHRRSDTTKPETNILRFASRCEVIFRENL